MKDDTISRQAVLKLLSTMPPEEAITKAMLIQSVKQMSAAQPTMETVTECNDLISRHEALKALKKNRFPGAHYIDTGVKIALREIKALPSAQPKSYREGYQAGFKDAQPERKRGKWKPYRCDMYKCSECSYIYTELTDLHRCGAKYCPNCGADMREVSE
jgi:membrane protease subunit (stomatin/prohibitin family)